MANKTQQIFELSQETAQKLSGIDGWTAFLRSAAWQYKYPFEDQLLIYAQRPDATACASLAVWNNRLYRWINKGAKGIALLRENERGHYLDYVFDISDTNSFYGNEVKLWNYHGRYDDEIIETLENTFGDLETKVLIADAVISAAHNAVTDNKSDYLDELQYAKESSFLDGYDELNLDVKFQRLAETSVAYMILCRMGLAMDGDFEREDFQDIVDFNTPETLSVLGNAVSDISEQALREISDTIRKAEREEKNKSKFFAVDEKAIYNESNETTRDIQNEERNEDNGRTDLHANWGLSDAGSDSRGAEPADRQIRNDTAEIPQKQPPEPVFGNENQGDIDGTLAGNGQNSEGASGIDGIADGTNGGRGRTDESSQSHDVDRADEQLQTRSRRNRNQQPSAQLSLFDLLTTEEEQQNIIREAAQNTFEAAFSMPQQIIDEVLCDVNASDKMKENAEKKM